MRLVSKYHDYYDGAIRTSASDKSFVFVRKQEEVLIDGLESVHVYYEHRKGNEHIAFESGIVGFCGKIHPYVRVTNWNQSFDEYGEHKYFYEADSLFEAYPCLAKVSKNRYSRYYYTDNEKKFEKWLKDGTVSYWKGSYCACEDPKLKNFFTEHRVAYFSLDPRKYRREGHMANVYPILKDLGFYKKKDSYSAFQDIEMFLTNELVKPDEIAPEIQATITDKLKVQSKGFDKWSFRKMKKDKK